MILADKIIRLRKKNGWSQEELAEKMKVSRQAVSKWEGAQTIPELEKVLMLAGLFGVTTDYLLRDEMEGEEFAEENSGASVRRITLAQANAFLERRESASVQIAVGTFLCIVAGLPLILLYAAAEVPASAISENMAGRVGLTALLMLVAAAVALFLFCEFKNAPFDFIGKEPFETEYGVTGMVRERQKAYQGTYARYRVAGTCISILAPVPLLIGAFSENDLFAALMFAATVLLAGAGVAVLIISGVRQAGMQKLLAEGTSGLLENGRRHIRQSVAAVYWLMVAAVYFGWSFWTNDWGNTWVLWVVAGILFVAVMGLCSLLQEKNRKIQK